MQPIMLTTVVDEKRRIMIDLPEDVPLGEVEVELVIRPLASEVPPDPITREWVQARLRAAGLLAEDDYEDDEIEELSPEEEERLGKLLAEPRSVDELIYEDREERF